MSSLFNSFGYCFWWFLAGILLGWLLNKWLCKCCSKSTPAVVHHTPAAPVKVTALTTVPVAPTPKTPSPATALIDLAAAKSAGFTLKNANDLTIVEGIGPKINELFNSAGIKTYAQLAAASVPQMRKILDDGGSRFRIANPSTWAQQAALAAANKWAELKKLQDDLTGGVKK